MAILFSRKFYRVSTISLFISLFLPCPLHVFPLVAVQRIAPRSLDRSQLPDDFNPESERVEIVGARTSNTDPARQVRAVVPSGMGSARTPRTSNIVEVKKDHRCIHDKCAATAYGCLAFVFLPAIIVYIQYGKYKLIDKLELYSDTDKESALKVFHAFTGFQGFVGIGIIAILLGFLRGHDLSCCCRKNPWGCGFGGKFGRCAVDDCCYFEKKGRGGEEEAGAVEMDFEQQC